MMRMNARPPPYFTIHLKACSIAAGESGPSSVKPAHILSVRPAIFCCSLDPGLLAAASARGIDQSSAMCADTSQHKSAKKKDHRQQAIQAGAHQVDHLAWNGKLLVLQ